MAVRDGVILLLLSLIWRFIPAAATHSEQPSFADLANDIRKNSSRETRSVFQLSEDDIKDLALKESDLFEGDILGVDKAAFAAVKEVSTYSVSETF